MRTIFIFISFFLSVNTFAQVDIILDIVSQVGEQVVPSKEDLMLQELKKINDNLEESNRLLEENNNKQQNIKEIQEEVRDRQKREEEALYKVPEYIKNGTNINNILDSEFNILNLIQELRNLSNSGNIDLYANTILTLLQKEVDTAVNVCTDDIYRMTLEERLSYLKETEANTLAVQNEIKSKINKEKMLQEAKKYNDKQNEEYQKLLDKKITVTPIQP